MTRHLTRDLTRDLIRHRTLVAGLAPLTGAELLRGFDDVRRDLAADVHGSPGAFAGFHRLDIDHRLLQLLCAGDEVAVSATVVRDTPRQTQVRFTATFTRVTASGWRADAEVASGTGVIVYPTARPDPQRSTFATA